MQQTPWVLLVDPDLEAVESLRALLEVEGIHADRAASIKEAATKLKVLRCGCMVIDVDLPEMKGYEAVPILKAIQPNTKVIMTATTNSKGLEAKVREQDVLYYHIKSFHPSELVTAVAGALRSDSKSLSEEKSRPTK